MLKHRTFSFILLAAILFFVIFGGFYGKITYCVLATFVSFFLSKEIAEMLKKIGLDVYPKIVASLTSIVVLIWVMFKFNGLHYIQNLNSLLVIAISIVSWTTIIMLQGVWLTLFFPNAKNVIKKYIGSIGAFIALFFMMIWGIDIYFLDRNNVYYFLYLILATKAMDTGGYIVGMLSNRYMKNGNHKILPKISPKKSWEGTIGGLVFSVGVSLIFFYFLNNSSAPILGTSLWKYILCGFLLGVGSLAGDLTESALKRQCNIKDSGNIIPGMGGVADLFDSFIYNGFIFYVILYI